MISKSIQSRVLPPSGWRNGGAGRHSPMALGGQRTAAVSPAVVIFHTTLEKLSSPHISWGSTMRNGGWERTQRGYIALTFSPFFPIIASVRPVTQQGSYQGTSSRCTAGAPPAPRGKADPRRWAPSRPSVSAGSHPRTSENSRSTGSTAATSHPL